MKEIAPGIVHWTAVHPAIGMRVSSYYFPAERVLLDPLLPPRGGLAWLRKHGPPEHILLTNRLHSRHSAQIVEAFGTTLWCHRRGLAHVRALGLRARAFEPGDALPGGGRAVEIGVLCPDESALHFPKLRAAAVADGVMRAGAGALTFVDDELLVDDPADAARVKRGLAGAYARLARRAFDHLLLAHGTPWIGDGREALRAWAARQRAG